MLNFNRSFTNNKQALEKFQAIIQKQTKEYYFLMILKPIMQQVLEKIQQFLSEHTSNVSDWLSEDFLIQFVVKRFMQVVNPMMIRACVMEMHLARRSNLLEGNTPEERFDFFLKNISEPENTKDFFNKYASLKKQIISFSHQFINTTSELFQRLDEDKEHLIKCFFHDKLNYHIESIYSSGDVHCQGRSVCILTFIKAKTKIKIVYKPRSVKLDVAFQNFISWFNKRDPILPLMKIGILDKESYGWCEFIEYTSCKNETEIKQFYTRMGKWLMLMYLFRGGDIHGENLIAHGAHPVVVDLECLFTPLYSYAEKPNKRTPRFFVFQCLFLPAQVGIDEKNKGLDISALGSEVGGESFIPTIKWIDIGKDTMHAERSLIKLEGFLNKPRLNYKSVEYLNYETELLKGFHDAYQIILQHKTDLLGANSPLQAFKQVPVRLVLRPTSTYFQSLYESWHPKYLLSNTKRKHYFRSLWAKGQKSPSYKALLEIEAEDLQQNNIPFFSAFSNGTQLFNSAGNTIDSPILKSGFILMLDHVTHTLSNDDLLLQQTFIKNSFSIAKENRNMNQVSPAPISLLQKPFSKEDLKLRALIMAKRVLDQLADNSYLIDDEIYWPSVYESEQHKWLLTSTNIDFYDGLSGIALCYLYASQIFPDKRYADISEQCFNTLKKWLKTIDAKNCNLMGAYLGGGFLYTLAAYYRINPDKKIKEIMQKCLKLLAIQIKKDEALDIISGAAGSIVLLLSLTDIFSKEILMPLVRACVKRILKLYPIPGELPLTEKTKTIKPLLGMAHGVAGIACALHKYFLIEPNKKIKDWIDAGLTYERNNFSKKNGNWPDLRKLDEKNSSIKESNFLIAWCYGAPGIGLARLDMSQHWKDKHIANEIKIALQTTIKQGFGGYACLCHGNFGNLDFISSVNEQRKDPILEQLYHQYASTLVSDLEQYTYQCCQFINSASPGLLTGEAGIAYQLMRTAFPKTIPSILLFQSNRNGNGA